MVKLDQGSNKSLFTLIAVVVFGIFLSLSYFLFQDNLKGILGTVMGDAKIGINTNVGSAFNETPPLVPNLESDFIFTSSSGTITGYTGTRLDLVIPETIGGVPVKVIGSNVFKDKGLLSVYIPESVITIGSSAFYNNLLTSIVIPKNVTNIGFFCI